VENQNNSAQSMNKAQNNPKPFTEWSCHLQLVSENFSLVIYLVNTTHKLNTTNKSTKIPPITSTQTITTDSELV
jgi:hypothetical protein